MVEKMYSVFVIKINFSLEVVTWLRESNLYFDVIGKHKKIKLNKVIRKSRIVYFSFQFISSDAWLAGLYELFSFVVLFSLECHNYQNLTSADRKTSYYTHSTCDDTIGPDWFRFQGAAGTKMATSCPPVNRCESSSPGWLKGGHPTVADGTVTRQVCFHWDSNCCNWSTNIQVRNCGSFYIYYFDGTPGCDLRYCGTDWFTDKAINDKPRFTQKQPTTVSFFFFVVLVL